jgi:hypothetical protein
MPPKKLNITGVKKFTHYAVYTLPYIHISYMAFMKEFQASGEASRLAEKHSAALVG